MTMEMKTTRMAPWFGADTAIAEQAARELGRPDWVGVGCVGGGSILRYLKCRGGVANDRHRHVINLFRVVADPAMKGRLIERLEATLFHPDELALAQLRCMKREQEFEEHGGLFGDAVARVAIGGPDIEWARDYFIAVWMGRGGQAGTHGEFGGSLPSRWNANGGGSSTRFRSAVESVEAWHLVARRWEWECLDVFEFISRIKNAKGLAGYFDPPWPDAGEGYKHTFTESQQRRLARMLAEYTDTRIVVRYGDHPLIREIYPASRWNIIEQVSRDQDNKAVAELLILDGPSFPPHTTPATTGRGA